MQFYMLTHGQRKGPFTAEQLAAEGLERDTLVWHTGQADWVRADQVPALGELLLTIPPPVPRPAVAPAPQALPAPPHLPDDFLFASAWVRYSPKIFRSLYLWYTAAVVLALILVATGIVLLILAANEPWSRQVAVADRWGNWENRWVPDLAARRRAQTEAVFGALSLAFGGLALVAGWVLFCVLLYKAWNQIQDGHARTSASKAVGFLFIPFFNLYWLFVAVYGLACDLHNYVVRRRLYGRHGLTPYPVSPGLSLACFILLVCNAVPFLNFVTFVPSLIVLLIWLHGVKAAAAGIAAARLAEPAWAPEPLTTHETTPVPIPVPVPVSDGKTEHVRRFDGEGAARGDSNN